MYEVRDGDNKTMKVDQSKPRNNTKSNIETITRYEQI